MARPKRKLVKVEFWAEMSAQAATELKATIMEVVRDNIGGELTYLAVDVNDKS